MTFKSGEEDILMDIKYFAKIFPKLTTDIKSKKLREHEAGKKIFNQDISYLNCCNQNCKGIQRKKIYYQWKNKSYRNLLIRNNINRRTMGSIFKVLGKKSTVHINSTLTENTFY